MRPMLLTILIIYSTHASIHYGDFSIEALELLTIDQSSTCHVVVVRDESVELNFKTFIDIRSCQVITLQPGGPFMNRFLPEGWDNLPTPRIESGPLCTMSAHFMSGLNRKNYQYWDAIQVMHHRVFKKSPPTMTLLYVFTDEHDHGTFRFGEEILTYGSKYFLKKSVFAFIVNTMQNGTRTTTYGMSCGRYFQPVESYKALQSCATRCGYFYAILVDMAGFFGPNPGQCDLNKWRAYGNLLYNMKYIGTRNALAMGLHAMMKCNKSADLGFALNVKLNVAWASENVFEEFEIMDVFVGDDNSFGFVTCSPLNMGQVEGLNFHAFVTPITSGVALAMVVSCIFISALETVGKGFSRCLGTICLLALELLDVIYALGNKNAYRFQSLIVLWTFLAMLVNNLYRSVITNDITAPLQSEVPTTFESLEGTPFKMLSTSSGYLGVNGVPISLTTYRKSTSDFDESLVQKTAEWLASFLVEKEQSSAQHVKMYFRHKITVNRNDSMSDPFLGGIAKKSIIGWEKRFTHGNKTMDDLNQQLTNMSLGWVLENVVPCDPEVAIDRNARCTGTVLVASSSYLQSEGYRKKTLGPTRRSHITRQPYSFSRNTLFHDTMLIKLDSGGKGVTAIKSVLRRILESGFTSHWRDMVMNSFVIDAKSVTDFSMTVEAQVLHSHILTCFSLWTVGCFLATLGLLLECSGRRRTIGVRK